MIRSDSILCSLAASPRAARVLCLSLCSEANPQRSDSTDRETFPTSLTMAIPINTMARYHSLIHPPFMDKHRWAWYNIIIKSPNEGLHRNPATVNLELSKGWRYLKTFSLPQLDGRVAAAQKPQDAKQRWYLWGSLSNVRMEASNCWI